MKVLRTSHEVAEVSERLRNCAASYVDIIQNDEYLMVALVQTATGQPMALGGIYKSDGTWDMGRRYSKRWNLVEHGDYDRL